MLASSLQLFRAPHEYHTRRLHEGSGCCEGAPRGHSKKPKNCRKNGGILMGHGKIPVSLRCSDYQLTHRRMCALALLLGSLVLLCSVGGGKAAAGSPPSDPPQEHGSSENYAGGDDRGERDGGGGSGDRVEANSPAKTRAKKLPGVPEWLWQQMQQQSTAAGERAIESMVSSWKSVLRFLEPLQQETPQKLISQSSHPHPVRTPQVQANTEGTSSRVVPEARHPVTSQQLGPEKGESPANGSKAGNPSAANTTPSSQAKSFFFRLSGLSPERQLTREEEEEEALADAIIHGTSKKRVPRVRTAVDSLVEAIEEEKLKQVAKSPRQLEHLRERRKADMEARKPTVQLPEYFVKLAKEAANFHQTQAQHQQQKKHPVGALGKRLHTLSVRQQQKDKLLYWRENQILQLPEDGPDLEKLMEEAQKTDKELSRTLLLDLPDEDLEWAGDTEKT